MTISEAKAKKCTTHHYACDCREYQMQVMEQALKVIRTWAAFDVAAEGKTNFITLLPTQVVELIDRTLSIYKSKEA